MKTHIFTIASSLFALGAAASPALAQSVSFPDMPANHWAYQAVQDLADKGFVKGYSDGKFLGKRELTRYEFASVIDRIVQTLSDLKNSPNVAPVTPTSQTITQDDLNKIQVLVDGFGKQLAAIQSLVAGATSPFQTQIDALRAQVSATQKAAAKAQDTADNSYGLGAGRKFTISGYIQSRFVDDISGDKSRFPSNGSATRSGAYNGNYGQGANSQSFEVRRARIKFSGQLTANTSYGAQIDYSGAVTTGATANQQVTTREAYLNYTFGSGSIKSNPTLTAGLFANPFGYEIGASTSSILTPERHLITSDAGTYGIFANQDYDKGIKIAVPAGPVAFTVALLNGTGRVSENTSRHIDSVYRAAYAVPTPILGGDAGIGVSYYNGQLPAVGAAAAITGVKYGAGTGKKELFGVDAQFTAPGPFIQAEYVGGKYEQVAFLADPGGASGPYYKPGNKIDGYSLQGGYSVAPGANRGKYTRAKFSGTTPKELTLAVSYDLLHRDTANKSLRDSNLGFGALYNLDKATRFRLWYIKPLRVADPISSTRINQLTGELQVRF